MTCPFCDIPADKYLAANEHFYLIDDKWPIARGHSLIISHRHVENYFELTPEESASMLDLVKSAKARLDEEHVPGGYKLLINCGAVAGQRVFHFHLHVIPYYD